MVAIVPELFIFSQYRIVYFFEYIYFFYTEIIYIESMDCNLFSWSNLIGSSDSVLLINIPNYHVYYKIIYVKSQRLEATNYTIS